MSILSDKVADPTYSGMSDAEVAAVLNALDQPGRVPPSEILSYVQENTHSDGRPLQGKIVALAEGRDVPSPSPPYTAAMCRDAAIIALRRMEVEVDTPVDMTKVSGMLDLLILGGALESEDKTAILAMANNRHSWAELNNLPHLRAGDIAQARSV